MLNPELRRNIWLDFTFHRVIIIPIVAILFVYLFYLTGGATSSASVAFNLACLFIFIWGTNSAAGAVIDEVSANTWDFQRQSALSPWQMTWGKLLGSTLYSWYGAAICLGFYALMSTRTTSPLFGFGFTAPTLSIIQAIALLFLGGLFAQGLALLFSLQIVPQMRQEKTYKGTRYFFAGLILGGFTTNFCFNAAKHSDATINWHDYHFALGPFAFYSLLMFLGWTIVGLQRSFCKELQYQNSPWVWGLFNIFCIVYFSGLTPVENLPLDNIDIGALRDVQKQLLHAPLYLAFFIAQALTYFALFTDTLSFIRYKYFITRLKEKNVLESLQQLPWWPISLACTIVISILVALAQQQSSQLMDNFSFTIFALTTVLFLIRDIALVHFFKFAKNPHKATGSAMLYLFILYLLLPLLLIALHMSNLLPLFLPSWGNNTVLAIISSVAQIAFLGMYCLRRWETLNKASAE